MPKRSRKPRDLNKLAASIVASATSDEPEPEPYQGKNPAAVELGRLGGLARAKALSPEKRKEIAQAARRARRAGP